MNMQARAPTQNPLFLCEYKAPKACCWPSYVWPCGVCSFYHMCRKETCEGARPKWPRMHVSLSTNLQGKEGALKMKETLVACHYCLTPRGRQGGSHSRSSSLASKYSSSKHSLSSKTYSESTPENIPRVHVNAFSPFSRL